MTSPRRAASSRTTDRRPEARNARNTAPQFDAPLTLWQTIVSVAASFFGVQSSQNRQRDFTRGKAGHFIVVGLIMTALFVLAVGLAVRLVLRHAGL
ncbi:Protein of unknown function [Fontimonas thermophila]|uniref:DUF2970 domain-containing protein n=1 Tax=Fontimonas thermophila TaxID=1076937 RepID=A0A1I2HNQ2_9GAMM|nr:DUF2970 domain-containing protein [Fontimonas thermophila]SFF30356.1 Protein of unknown function [Fontimonas thermophila]